MTLLGALRAAALEDKAFGELLGGTDHWHLFQAPQAEHDPCVVVQFVDGTTVQDHAGLDGLRHARVQVDAWAEGVGADALVERLGRAAQAAIVRGCNGGVFAGTRLLCALLVADSERHEIDSDLDTQDDPPVRFGFDVVVSFQEV